jgi:transcriptional regulator with XRE-family HTH domain
MAMTLSEARGLVEWTQSELARRAGEPQSNIAALENGRNNNPSHALVMKIVTAFRAGGLPGFRPEDLAFSGSESVEKAS